MPEHALDRTEQFVGREGQARLRRLSVTLLGGGGIGSHLVQQLTYLRVGRLASSRNRYIGSRFDDPVGMPKVELAARTAAEIEPATEVLQVREGLRSAAAIEAVVSADYVFGCVDNDGTRFILNELCAAYARPLIDVATEIPPEAPMQFGGRVCIAAGGTGCLYCLDVLDMDEVKRDLGGPELARDHERMYGVPAPALPGGGPAVVTLNGVLASLAATEFLVWATGLRSPHPLLTYHGDSGKVTRSPSAPSADCYYCRSVFGTRERANVERYILARP